MERGDGLAAMVCDGGMIAMISHGRDGSAGWLQWFVRATWMKWFVIYSRDEMARHGWNE